MDWPGLAAELARLFADARSVKEAEVFATGKGSESIPQGLITGATKIVSGGTKEVIKIADIYALQEALAARWQPRATFLGTNTAANAIHKMVATGDTTNATLMSDDRSEILGKPFREVSTMSAKLTTKKERVLAYGDVAAAYRIVDRLGLTVEPVPLVTKEGIPTGQRGLYAYFRVGAEVIIPEAVQVLAVKDE
jgi:HK97 family phage major capsid protein